MEDGNVMIKIIYEDNHVLVVEKPINIPIQKDDSHDMDFITIIKKYLKEKYNKRGNVYLGLIHRLDRPVGGIMIFAKTSKAASRLSEQMRQKNIQKKYYAVVQGIDLQKDAILKDYLLKNKKKNKVFVNPYGKEAVLYYEVITCKDNLSLIDIQLYTGRSHQIRVQFSSRGYPLYGDQKYNKQSMKGKQIALFSYQISFYHPITREYLTFTLEKPNRYPFSLFQK